MGKLNYAKVFSLFIIIVMVGSVFLYSMSGNDDEEELPSNAIKVKNYTFYETAEGAYGIMLMTNVGQEIPILFRTDPRAAEYIELDSEATNVIKSANKIYFTYDPNQENIIDIGPKLSVAMAQLSRIVPLVVPNVKPVLAQTADVPNDETDDFIPIKTCADATETAAVVLFELASSNQVILEDNCVKIQAVDEDALINASDKLGMNLVNIIV